MKLETAKKLKEAGWEKETLWAWELINIHKNQWCVVLTDAFDTVSNTWYPAPSTDELLAELPNGTTILKHPEYGYVSSSLDNYSKCFYNTDPAECLANLWLQLKQEKII